MLILCIPNVNGNISNLYYHSEKMLLNNNINFYFDLELFPGNVNTLYISIVNTVNGNISNMRSGKYFILSNETRREKNRR